jgi:hypothetical protein
VLEFRRQHQYAIVEEECMQTLCLFLVLLTQVSRVANGLLFREVNSKQRSCPSNSGIQAWSIEDL